MRSPMSDGWEGKNASGLESSPSRFGTGGALRVYEPDSGARCTLRRLQPPPGQFPRVRGAAKMQGGFGDFLGNRVHRQSCEAGDQSAVDAESTAFCTGRVLRRNSGVLVPLFAQRVGLWRACSVAGCPRAGDARQRRAGWSWELGAVRLLHGWRWGRRHGGPDRRQCQVSRWRCQSGRVPVPQCGHCTAFVILTAQDEQRLLRGLCLQLKACTCSANRPGIAGGICRRGRNSVG